MLLDEECDEYNVYSNETRQEFIFRIFQMLVLGGVLCQYEDTLQPYLDVTKKLYKSLSRFIGLLTYVPGDPSFSKFIFNLQLNECLLQSMLCIITRRLIDFVNDASPGIVPNFVNLYMMKEFFRVEKQKRTNDLSIGTMVLEVVAKNHRNEAYFPYDPYNLQNIGFLIIDPKLRHVTTFLHQFS